MTQRADVDDPIGPAARHNATEELATITRILMHVTIPRVGAVRAAYRAGTVDAINAAVVELREHLEELGPRLAAVRGVDEP